MKGSENRPWVFMPPHSKSVLLLVSPVSSSPTLPRLILCFSPLAQLWLLIPGQISVFPPPLILRPWGPEWQPKLCFCFPRALDFCIDICHQGEPWGELSPSDWQVRAGSSPYIEAQVLKTNLPVGVYNGRSYRSFSRRLPWPFSAPLSGGSWHLLFALWDTMALINGLKGSVEVASATLSLWGGCCLSEREKYWFSIPTTYFLEENSVLSFCMTKCPW